jgi:hypothetical protein
MLAGFLAMVWLIPFDAVTLPIPLPVDSQLDRFVVPAIALVWLIEELRAPPRGYKRVRQVDATIWVFFSVALLSVLVNFDTLSNLNEFDLAIKKIGLLASYVLLYVIVARSIRPSELKAFTVLMLILACFTAVGTVYEYNSKVNIFYKWTDAIMPPSVTVLPAPNGPTDELGRTSITGPTSHGLAVATLFAMVLPFGLIGMLSAGRDMRKKLLYALAAGIIVAGAVATVRKTAVVAPAAGLAVLLLYRPSAIFRFVPLALVMFVTINVVSPGALSTLDRQLGNGFFGELSVKGRTDDYAATQPDITTHLALGRGYGTYDPFQYRLVDNQYLLLVIETGLLGVAAYLAIAIAIWTVNHPAVRGRDPIRGPPALAISAATASFVVSTALFDVLSFPHVPYLFFFLAGMATAAASTRVAQPAIRAPIARGNGGPPGSSNGDHALAMPAAGLN